MLNDFRKEARFTAAACGLGLVMGIFLSPLVARADDFNQASEFTFSRAVELPGGKVLAPGTYWLLLPDPAGQPNLVGVFNSDRSSIVAAVPSDPTARGGTPPISVMTGNPISVITTAQPSGSGPDVLLDWYYSGSVSGHHFTYSRNEQVAISEESHSGIEANDTPVFYDRYADYPDEVSLQAADDAVQAALSAPNQIPRSLLDRAPCVVVAAFTPNTALIDNSTHGRAIMVCRTGLELSGAWGSPVMYTLGGGNVGTPTAAPYSDYILLVMNSRAMERILSGPVALGRDLSVAPGPAVGASGENRADILAYSRVQGAFSGESLAGSVLAPNADANQVFYGPNRTPEEIARETAADSPLAGQPLLALLDRFSPHGAS